MSKGAWFFGVVLAMGGSFFVGRYYGDLVAGRRVPGMPRSPEEDILETHRTLLLLVDGPDVFCANDKVAIEAIDEYVHRTMELNRVGRVLVCGSSTARFGDVVKLVDKLTKRGLKTNLTSSHTIPSGTRLPLTFVDHFGSGYWGPN